MEFGVRNLSDDVTTLPLQYSMTAPVRFRFARRYGYLHSGGARTRVKWLTQAHRSTWCCGSRRRSRPHTEEAARHLDGRAGWARWDEGPHAGGELGALLSQSERNEIYGAI